MAGPALQVYQRICYTGCSSLPEKRYLPPQLGPHAEVTDDAAHLRNGALQILPGVLYEQRQLLQSLLLGLCGIPLHPPSAAGTHSPRTT